MADTAHEDSSTDVENSSTVVSDASEDHGILMSGATLLISDYNDLYR